MTVPILLNKVGDPRILFSAASQPKPQAAPPQRMLLCYQDRLFNQLTKVRWRPRRRRGQHNIAGLYGAACFLPGTAHQVGLIGKFGVGGPITAILLEKLAAWGVREVVIVGMAGGLHHQLKTGDIVLVSDAIRDEGTSYHYLPSDHVARPHPGLLGRLKTNLEQADIPFYIGATWTTDAPYRETWLEQNHFSANGVLTVEMEMATLFCVAHYLGLIAGGLLVVGDHATEKGWAMGFDSRLVNQRLLETARIASRTDTLL